MNSKIKVFFTATLIVIAALGGGQLCRKKNTTATPVSLEIWNLYDSSDQFSVLLNEYTSLPENKSVDIIYKKKSPDTYQDELLNALSTPGSGPDIFAIGNEWVPSYKDRIVAMPDSVGSATDFRATFVDVAVNDLVLDGKVVGVPTYVDSLALFYNKDLLNSAGVVKPPTTWQEFQSAVIATTSKDDSTGQILQAGAAIGTANNVNNATKILSLLMLQSGTEMITEAGGVEFQKDKVIGGTTVKPGLNSLNFYTNFAQANKEAYTWNVRETDAVTAFTSGHAAMMLGYAYQIPEIQAKAPKLNFGIAKAPQIAAENPKIALASYWPLVVSANSTAEKQLESWKFLEYVAERSQSYNEYLSTAGRPTAKRSNIPEQTKSPLLGPFAEQALYARSRFIPDITKTDQVYAAMIQSVVLGESVAEDAINQAAQKMGLLYDIYIQNENARIEKQTKAAATQN